MITVKQSQVLVGHSKYGDPPVVVFSVEPTKIETSEIVARQCIRMLHDLLATRPRASVAVETSGTVPLMAECFVDTLQSLMHLVMHRYNLVLIESQAEDHAFNVVVSCEEPQTCVQAGEVAASLIDKSLDSGCSSDVLHTLVNDFLQFSKARLVDDNTHLLRLAAKRRGIPVIDLELDPFVAPLPEQNARHGLIQIGQGINQHRLLGSLPDRQPIPLTLLKDRRRLIPHLAASGLPLARYDKEFTNSNRLSRALRTAARLGFPVAMKPAVKRNLSYRLNATGEFGALTSPDQLNLAFDASAGDSHAVWIEEHIPGDNYRFLIVGGQVHAVARRQPPTLTGDGVTTLRDLVHAHAEQATSLVKRHAWQDMLNGDADVDMRLRLANVTWDSIVPAGLHLALRAHGTPYNGGGYQDVTDHVPEAYKRIAEQAAACCELALLGGVDMVIRTMDEDARYPNCIVENVMPDPDLLTHCQPDKGAARNVGDALIEALFPFGRTGRIPIVAVTGTNGKTTTSRMIAHILRHTGLKVGLSTTISAQVDDDVLVYGDLAGVPGAAFVLNDPRTEAAVLEVARGGLIRQGMPFDHCNVGVCLNVEADHIGLDGIESIDQMARVKSGVIKRSQDAIVLNADDKRVLAMASVNPAARVILVSAEPVSRTVCEHLASGGEALLIQGEPGAEHLVWHAGEETTPLLAATDIPATYEGMVQFNTSNAAYAAAAAFAMGVPLNRIAEALACFTTSFESNPGRFNVYDGLPFKVIFDYAHNAHGLRALTEAVRQWPVSGRRILVSRGPADRSFEEIHEMARAVAGKFDLYICTNSLDLRGHEPTEVPEIYRSTLLSEGISESTIFPIPDRIIALKTALRLAQRGDLLIIIAGKDIYKLRELLKTFSSDKPEEML